MSSSVSRCLGVLCLVAGCGVLSQEEQLLTRYFEASRLHDTTVVATMSTVVFNPRIEGVVQDFEVTRVDRAGDIERVIIDADIRSPAGQLMPRRLEATLERRNGRWFITGLR
jgi:hypothetical protein